MSQEEMVKEWVVSKIREKYRHQSEMNYDTIYPPNGGKHITELLVKEIFDYLRYDTVAEVLDWLFEYIQLYGKDAIFPCLLADVETKYYPVWKSQLEKWGTRVQR